MHFEYDKLKGRIIEKFGTQARFAKEMNWSERTMSLKMKGDRPWKQTDICRAIGLLGLSKDDISTYFFTSKVQNIELLKREEGTKE